MFVATFICLVCLIVWLRVFVLRAWVGVILGLGRVNCIVYLWVLLVLRMFEWFVVVGFGLGLLWLVHSVAVFDL